MIGLGLACVALTLTVLGPILWPLLRGARAGPSRTEFDLAVYRDQLKEIDRDVARGLIGTTEATSARLEIQRRMLAAPPADAAPLGGHSSVLTAGLALAMVAGASGLYLILGNPAMSDRPVAALAPAPAGRNDIENTLNTLETALRQDPTNVARWLLYARGTAAIGRWEKSIDAYRQVMRLTSAQPDVISAYGETLVLAADGIVSPAAHTAFAEAVRLDPTDEIARFYLALAALQAGEPGPALQGWLELAGDLSDGSAIRDEAVRRITDTAKRMGLSAPPIPPPASAGAAVAQRATVGRDMVERLAARLVAQPGDFDGWLRLGRAFLVLGEPDKSDDAYDHAAKLRPSDNAVPLQQAQALIDSRPTEAPIPPRAVALLRQVEAADPRRAEALWLLGAASAQGGRADEAEAYWQRLLALLPPDGEDARMLRDAIATLRKR